MTSPLPWQLARPEDFAALRDDLLCRFPGLRVELHDRTVHIVGFYPVVSEGEILDRFEIDICLPHDYPLGLPTIRETGGQIPQEANRHISPDGTACVVLFEARWRDFPEGSDLIAFLDGPVRNFFISQRVFEKTRRWPFGQWEHGKDGVFDYYEELLGTRDPFAIARFLDCLSFPKTRGHAPCPCGQGARLRKCHIDLVRDLRTKIPRSHAQACRVQFDKWLPHQPS